jgi:hypothetical protein
MTTSNEPVAIHPLGEGEFAFPTPGGRVRLSVTKDNLTPFGGDRNGVRPLFATEQDPFGSDRRKGPPVPTRSA